MNQFAPSQGCGHEVIPVVWFTDYLMRSNRG